MMFLFGFGLGMGALIGKKRHLVDAAQATVDFLVREFRSCHYSPLFSHECSGLGREFGSNIHAIIE
jgi:hypothetical protein